MLYVVLIGAAFVMVPVLALPVGFGLSFAWIALLALPLAFKPVRSVSTGAVGAALIPVLQATGILLLAFGLLLGIGIGLS